jgi:hypothetical protein
VSTLLVLINVSVCLVILETVSLAKVSMVATMPGSRLLTFCMFYGLGEIFKSLLIWLHIRFFSLQVTAVVGVKSAIEMLIAL